MPSFLNLSSDHWPKPIEWIYIFTNCFSGVYFNNGHTSVHISPIFIKVSKVNFIYISCFNTNNNNNNRHNVWLYEWNETEFSYCALTWAYFASSARKKFKYLNRNLPCVMWLTLKSHLDCPGIRIRRRDEPCARLSRSFSLSDCAIRLFGTDRETLADSALFGIK